MNKKTFLKKVYSNTFFLNGPLSIFFNSSFLVRRGFFKHILGNKNCISGDVLDLGCGSKPYKELFTYKSYVGIDVDTGAHSHKEEAVDVFYDGRVIPFPDKNFDSVFSSQVFEHIENLDFSLDEVFRVLRPGGILFITVPFVGAEYEIPYDFRRMTSFGIKSLLERHQFSVIKIEKVGGYLDALMQTFIFYVVGFFPKNKIARLPLTLLIVRPTEHCLIFNL